MIKNPLGLYIDEFHWDKVARMSAHAASNS